MSETDQAGGLARWRRLLEDRTIPAEIIAAAPAPPFTFSPEAFARTTQEVVRRPPSLAARRALEALPEGGSVLDVGVGTGSASLVLAPPAARITGIDISEGMLREFSRLGALFGVRVEAILGAWPGVAARVPVADVAVCHSVLYSAVDLAAFAGALTAHARRRVVVLIPDVQWLAWQDDLWWEFHRVRRTPPATAADAAAALREVGLRVHREDEPSRVGGGADTRDDAVAEVRRRLCLSREHDAAVAAALGPRLRQVDGRWLAGPVAAGLAVTLWWDSAQP